jgi:EF hand domain-containing protein
MGKRWRGYRGALCATAAALAVVAIGCGDEDDDDSQSAATTTTAGDFASVEEFIRADHAELDSDGDGSHDTEESEAGLRGDFADADVDGDGAITLDDIQQELDDTGGGKADQPLSYYFPYDADGDDELSEEEYVEEGMKQTIAVMDADGDGEITADEAVQFHFQQAAGAGG